MSSSSSVRMQSPNAFLVSRPSRLNERLYVVFGSDDVVVCRVGEFLSGNTPKNRAMSPAAHLPRPGMCGVLNECGFRCCMEVVVTWRSMAEAVRVFVPVFCLFCLVCRMCVSEFWWRYQRSLFSVSLSTVVPISGVPAHSECTVPLVDCCMWLW